MFFRGFLWAQEKQKDLEIKLLDILDLFPDDNSSDKLNKRTFNQKDLVKTKLPISVNCITLIHELQVVSVLRSYSRLKPTDSDSMKEIIREEGENTEFSKEVSLRRTDGRYVGMRSHGEGIFITLDPVQVAAWMDKIKGSEISERILNKVNNPDIFEDEKNTLLLIIICSIH